MLHRLEFRNERCELLHILHADNRDKSSVDRPGRHEMLSGFDQAAGLARTGRPNLRTSTVPILLFVRVLEHNQRVLSFAGVGRLHAVAAGHFQSNALFEHVLIQQSGANDRRMFEKRGGAAFIDNFTVKFRRQDLSRLGITREVIVQKAIERGYHLPMVMCSMAFGPRLPEYSDEQHGGNTDRGHQ